jgi:hypothetical protein
MEGSRSDAAGESGECFSIGIFVLNRGIIQTQVNQNRSGRNPTSEIVARGKITLSDGNESSWRVSGHSSATLLVGGGE